MLTENSEGLISNNKKRLPSNDLMTDDVRLKMEIVQSLTEPCDRATYSKRTQWEVGECQHCGLQFEKMAKHQRKL